MIQINWTNLSTKALDEKQTWTTTVWVYRPGAAEPEKYEETPWPSLNELGADGWELVGRTFPETRIATLVGGWGEAAIPVRTDSIFKRPKLVDSS